MKSLKIIILFAVVVAVLCNCTSVENGNPKPMYASFYYYLLLLSFQDASGTDLVKGIEFTEEQTNSGPVHPSLYKLNAVFPNGIYNPTPRYTMDNNEGILFYDDGKDRLSFASLSYKVCFDSKGNKIKDPFVEKITYKLMCHHVFGDDEEHEIITWWELGSRIDVEDSESEFALCYRIDFDGKVFTEISDMSNESATISKVVWEGK